MCSKNLLTKVAVWTPLLCCTEHWIKKETLLKAASANNSEMNYLQQD
jgi:hypothetical protein